MNAWIAYLHGYGIVVTYLVGASVLAFGLIGAAVVFPRLLLFLLLAATVVFPSSPSTGEAGESGFNVYGKGGGYLFFSVFELAIIAVAVCLPIVWMYRPGAAMREGRLRIVNPYSKYFFLLFVVFGGYVIHGLIFEEHGLYRSFSRSGVVNIFFQWFIVMAVAAHLTEVKVRDRLLLGLVVVLLAQAVWGGFRYIFLGGDPQSSYEGDGSTLRITFWDINYIILAAMGGAWFLWKAVTAPHGRGHMVKFLGISLFFFALIALSARRTGQIGAVLALLGVLMALPRGKRWLPILILASTIPLVVYKLNARIDDDRPFIVKMLKGTEQSGLLVDTRYQRSYELKLAWEEVKRAPIFGVGPAGGFEPRSSQGLEYHKGNYGFIHSGFGHVLLKLGFVGLVLYFCIFFTYLLIWKRKWRSCDRQERGILIASMAGFLCSVPNLLVGTPVIEIRSMVVLGIIIALPLVVDRRDPTRAPTTSGLSVRGLRGA